MWHAACGSMGSCAQGGRALAKHTHRDTTAMFWPPATGTDHNKNTQALHVLHTIIADLAWLNIHMLPHDV